MTIDASNVVVTTTAEEGNNLVTRDAQGNVLSSVPLPPDRVNAKTMAAALAALVDANSSARQAMTTNATYLGITSPTNAQVAAQVKALTNQNQVIIPRLLQLARLVIGDLASDS